MSSSSVVLRYVLNGLMRRYRERVPDVGRIFAAMVREGIIESEAEIENDHIAFRTMGVPYLGIASFEKIFLHYGYERRDAYRFEEKRLDARWYSPPEPRFPRIFVSELRAGDLSSEVQRTIEKYTGEVTADPVDALDLDDAAEVDIFLHKALWSLPSYADYQQLAQESEYAAWAIYNRYYLNHFTISLYNLGEKRESEKPGSEKGDSEGYDTCAGFNAFLKQQGFKLNTSGGEIKRSPDGLLLQSSTVSASVDATFAGDETRPISGSYVEFAERRVLPQFTHLPKEHLRREHRRDGFEAGNADKIFESTYSTQTGLAV
jgi:hypothetical protein